MQRRIFLRGLAGLCGLAGGGALAGAASRAAKTRLVNRLADELTDSAGVTDLGRTYLRLQPEGLDTDALIAALVSELDGLAMFTGASGRRAALRAAVARDFESARTVVLDGWELSRTEARLSAVAALRSARGTRAASFGAFAHRTVAYDDLPRAGSANDAAGVTFELSLTVILDRAYRPRHIELGLTAADTYRLYLYRNRVMVDTHLVRASRPDVTGMAAHRVALEAQPIDIVRIRPRDGRYPYRLGHLRLVE